MTIQNLKFNPVYYLNGTSRPANPEEAKTPTNEKPVDNSPHYSVEQIEGLKKDITNAQEILKGKIREYKFWCAQYGVEPSADLASWERTSTRGLKDLAYGKGETMYDVLSRCLDTVQKTISKVSDEIGKLTITQANEKTPEEAKKISNEHAYSADDIENLQKSLPETKANLDAKLSEYTKLCFAKGMNQMKIKENLTEILMPLLNLPVFSADKTNYTTEDYDILFERLHTMEKLIGVLSEKIEELNGTNDKVE